MLKTLKYCCLLVSFVVAGALGAQQPASVVSKNASEKMAQEMLGDFTQLKKDPSSIRKVFNTIIEKCKEPAIDVAQLLPCAIIVYFLATIVHHYGHVAATNALFNVKAAIAMCAGDMESQQLCDVELLYIMNFLFGIERFFGGFSAAAVLYACITATCKYCTHVDGRQFSKITLKNIFTGFSPFQTIVQTKAFSVAQKRFLLNLTFVMSTALFYQMLCAAIDSFQEKKSYIIDSLCLAPFLISEGMVVKKYYDARKQLLYPVAK